VGDTGEADQWRRRRRTGGFTFLWGMLGALAGVVYGLITAGQPDTPMFDVLSALGIVLLFIGLGVAGIGLLGWLSAVVALRRRHPERHQEH
jgi:hypothetical protein